MNERMTYTKSLDALKGLSYQDQVMQLTSARPDRGQDGIYNVYGDTIGFYQLHFNKVLEGQRIIDFLESRETPLVIDLMGPSKTTRDLFTKADPQPGRRGIAVTLEERRPYGERSRDKQHRIKELHEDLTTEKGYRSVIKEMKGQRADLIMERALRGLEHIPVHPEYYRLSLERIWNMLDENEGMFLGQTLPKTVMEDHGIPVTSWLKDMQNNGIDIKFQDADAQIPYGALRLIKHTDSPRRLQLHVPMAA